MAYRLLIIQPSFYRSETNREVARVRRRRLVPLTLPYLAALTPREWNVTLVDEILEPVDPAQSVDLVAITMLTAQSLRGYDLATAFRQRGVPVVIGGPHAFFYPEETAQHCDAVAVGEGEVLWPQILADAAAGRLRREYRAESLPNLAGLPLPRYELLDLRRYGLFKTFTVQTSRGCPFRCEFCSERLYLGEGYRCRPVADILAEVKHCRSRNIFFAASTFAGDKTHAMELMAALVPLRIRWSTLWTLALCKDKAFMDLAQHSGLLHINIGVESISDETLKGMNKRHNHVADYPVVFADLRRRGVSFSLNFIFGWDGEERSIFRRTLKFLCEQRVPAAYFNILTPEKGTPFYDEMLRAGRILDPDEVGRWPGKRCYIVPAYCNATELEHFVRALHREFYSLRSIFRRMPLPVTKANIASWFLNLSQHRLACARDLKNSFAEL